METPFPADRDALIHQLRERIKELDCLYAISDLAANPSATLDAILQDIADAIPSAFQRPASSCVRIEVGERTAQTANFTTCEWTLERDITHAEAVVGGLTVGHLGAPPPDEPIFLEEERKLVREIADRIGKVVQYRILADTLARSEREFRSLVDNAPVGIFRTTLGGDLLYANNAGLRIFGHESLEEARSLGSPLVLYRNPEDRKALVSALQATGKVCRVEVECLTKTGEPIVVLFSTVLEAGVFAGMAIDLTERRRAHDALVESERRLNEAQRIAKLGYWEWDIITGAVRSSDEFARILGFRPKELTGKCPLWIC